MRSVTRHADSDLELLIARILALPAPLVRRIVHHLIDHLDRIDGDLDLEDDGDVEAIDEREPEHVHPRQAPRVFSQIRIAGH
jgi:hypothetical protein